MRRDVGAKKYKLLHREDWDLVRRIFDECVELPEAEREKRLASLTDGRPELRAEVDSLLASSTHEEEFLEKPIVDSLANIAAEKKNKAAASAAAAAAGEAPIATKYRFVRQLGMGGMAEVFLALMTGPGGFEKRVAVKRLLPVYTDDESFTTLFENEARLSSLLTQANIVQVFDYLHANGHHMLVMEYVEGKNLAQIIRRLEGSRLKLICLLHIIKEAAKGLDYAHSRCDDRTGEPLHIVHRDVSPKNLMVTYDGDVKIVDFGIANAKDRAKITQSGSLRGTIQYMSPEQTLGEKLDGRSDIFSLALVLYECLTGGPLFTADSALALLREIQGCSDVFRKISELKVPDEIQRILRKALARDRALRYGTAAELARDIQRFLNANFTSDPAIEVKAFMRRIFADDIQREQAANAAEPTDELTVMAPPLGGVAKSGLVSGMPPGMPLSKKLAWLLGMSLAFAATVAVVKVSLVSVFRPGTTDEAAMEEGDSAESGRAPTAALGENDCLARVESFPSGAKVSVNGLLLGRTPTSIEAPCNQSVELELAQEGFDTVTHTIKVQEKAARLVLTLMPKEAPLGMPGGGRVPAAGGPK